MIKALTWFSRKPGMSIEDFRGYWREEHPKAVLARPGLVAYTQNPVNDIGASRGRRFCDGVAETWWESIDAVRAHRDTDELAALMADEDQFINPEGRHTLLMDEVVIIDGSPGPAAIKQFSWLKRRPDLSVDEAQAYWRDTHGPLAATVPGMVRYVQNHVIADHYRKDREPIFDGVPVAHLADLDAARDAGRSDELAATRADEANFLNGDPLPWAMATEIKIL
ncbi:MAG: EthD family reductase [Actinomycetota bacterium]